MHEFGICGVSRVLTLIGMTGDIFICLRFLNQILSADFLSKLYTLFGGENWHRLSYFDTLPSLLSFFKDSINWAVSK